MDDFQSKLIFFLEGMKKQKEEDDKLQLIKEQFASMEQRYHTWMNYYSLFNGALLVAYCTILVSTGNVVEKVICDEKTCYDLNCTYWGFLVLIACLGVVASYCWYLSMIGHNKWLGNWRSKLQEEEPKIMKNISGDNLKLKRFCGRNILPGFYSTAKITKVFIFVVMIAWGTVLFYSISKYVDSNTTSLFIFLSGLSLSIILCFLEYFLYLFLGSSLNGFTINSKSVEAQKMSFCEMLSDYFTSSSCNIFEKIFVFAVMLLLTIFVLTEGQIWALIVKFGEVIME